MSSSYNPLLPAAKPLHPSGGGRGLGGAQTDEVAHADEDAEEVISQPDPFLDAAIVRDVKSSYKVAPSFKSQGE